MGLPFTLPLYPPVDTNLSVNVTVRLPHPRSGDTQGYRYILYMYILYMYVFIYVYMSKHTSLTLILFPS